VRTARRAHQVSSVPRLIVWHNGHVAVGPHPLGRSPFVATLLATAGIVLFASALGPWVVTHTGSGGIEHLDGLRIGGRFMWIVELSLLLTAIATALRGPLLLSGVLAIGVGAFAGLFAQPLGSDIADVRGYLRVEGSAAGIANRITLSTHHPITALERGWGSNLLFVAAGLAFTAGVAAFLTVMRLDRERRLTRTI
jgi:hypothetical protein